MDMSLVDMSRVPRHVGLILDGNGRWANRRGLHRTMGHQAGEHALFDTVHGALALGIEWLTAFTFSTENWTRDSGEVAFLIFFNRDLLLRRRAELHDLGIRVWFAGDITDERIPEENRKYMEGTVEMTASNQKMNMVFAFNYGSRREIGLAAREIARKAAAGEIDPETVGEDTIARYLWVPEMPDVDLIIRSSGEHRISNFLLWQGAYAEFCFPGILWPDFNRQSLADAVVEYQNRDRRFGGAVDTPTT